MMQEVKEIYYVVFYKSKNTWKAIEQLQKSATDAAKYAEKYSKLYNCPCYWRAVDLAHATAELPKPAKLIDWDNLPNYGAAEQ